MAVFEKFKIFENEKLAALIVVLVEQLIFHNLKFNKFAEFYSKFLVISSLILTL
jgi:hypothetical protein